MDSSPFRIASSDGDRLSAMLSETHFQRLTDIHLKYLETVDSTQSFMSSVLNSDHEGDLVVSEVQTGGKGREGRSWVSNKGGMWLTITLKPPTSRVLEKIVFIGAKAIVRTLEQSGLTHSTIKPPNDVYYGGKKIAGLLADTIVQGNDSKIYLGVGIDVNNDISAVDSISQIATSVANIVGREIDLVEFTVSFVRNLDAEYYGELDSHISTN